MDKAAEKWEKHARAVQEHESNPLKDSYTSHIAEDYLNGIDDYKSALRVEIEKEIAKPIEGKSMWRFGHEAGLRTVLDLLEKVEPNNQKL